jgi:asparagine synthase (glutamine-hydrolysing)
MLAATYFSGRIAGHGARIMGRGAYPNWLIRRELQQHGVTAGVPNSLVGYPVSHAPESRYLQQHLFKSQSGGDLRRLLRHGDRSSMAHSVESRLPYLGQELIAFVNSLPESFLLSNGGETKHILRKSLINLIPSEILQRRDKVGFETPETEWMWNIPLSKIMLEDGLSPFSWIDVDKLQSKLENSSRLAWRVRNLCKWSERFF